MRMVGGNNTGACRRNVRQRLIVDAYGDAEAIEGTARECVRIEMRRYSLVDPVEPLKAKHAVEQPG